MKTPSLKKNVVLNAMRVFMSTFFPIITFPYASRVLLPEGIGMVSFARSFVDFFIMIASLGVGAYGVREIAKVRDNKAELSTVTKEIFTINICSTAVAYFLLFAAVFFVPKLSEYRSLIILISSKILFIVLGFEWLFGGLEDFKYITVRAFFFQILSVALLYLFVKEPDDYLIYASIAVISNVGSNICNWFYSRKFIDFSLVKKLELKKHLKPIFILFATAVVGTIHVVLDKIMLGIICDDWHVGIYTVADKINRLVIAMVLAVGAVVVPRISYYFKKGEIGKFKELVHKNFDFMFLISLPCFVGLFLVGKAAILAFCGDDFTSSIPVMRMMTVLIVIIGINGVFSSQTFIPMGKEKSVFYYTCVAVFINVILNFILIPLYNVYGASIATVCSEFVFLFLMFYHGRKIVDLKQVSRYFLLYLFNASVMGIFVYICIRIIPGMWLSTGVAIFTGLLVYVIMLILEKNRFVMDFLKAIQRRLSRG